MEIKAKKSLGQNFLCDDIILNKIANSCEVLNSDLIIEIGPGKGALTKKLKQKNAQVIAFEIDERMKPILSSLEDNLTKVIYNDFLKIDLDNILKEYKYNKLFVIANIPYYITTPIIKKLLKIDNIQNIVLLVQKEYAERVTAIPCTKQYDSLTVYLQSHYKITKLFNVKNTSFSPAPKVDSAVIKFEKNNLKIENEEKFLKLVDDSFRFKRKTLKNNLKNYDWTVISGLLKPLGYNDNVRAEEIKIEDYIELSKQINIK